jgi:hypothetical protein
MKLENLLGVGFVAMLLAGDARAQAPIVWISDGLVKIQPNNPTPGSQSSISISAARNEFESFQVHVLAGSAPVALSVSVSDFVNTADGTTIPASANVAVFREGYINVTTPSDLNGLVGQVPDQLIPVEDAYFHQPRNAFPVTVPVGETQSVWVDVFVPVSAESGYYTASVSVLDGGSLIATLPVQLKVWNFSLPATASLKSSFGMGYGGLAAIAYGSTNSDGAYPGAGGDPFVALNLIHAAVATFFLDHRVSVTAVLEPTIPEGQWSQFDSIYGPLLSGTEPTIIPSAHFSSTLYPNTLVPADEPDLTDWTSQFATMGWTNQLFGYLCDEPPVGCAWDTISTNGPILHSLAPTLPLLVTTSISLATENNVLDDIDILAPVLDYVQPMNLPSTRPAYDTWLQTPGKQLWWYQSCDQHESCTNGTPGPVTSTWASYMIDASPVRNRIFQWLAYLYGIQGELYYSVEFWGADPWADVYSSGGNGEGILYYPGTVAEIGGTVPVPVASMRLKLIRDGMEDYEYLNLLSQAGQTAFAQTQINSFIQNAYTFNNDPGALQSARTAMGELLHQLSIDVTSQVSMAATGLGYNRGTKLFAGTFTVTNTSGSTIAAPLQLMLSGLPAGVTLTNATGTTVGGSPYITLNSPLAPGASAKFSLLFSNPGNVPASYTPEVFSGVL